MLGSDFVLMAPVAAEPSSAKTVIESRSRDVVQFSTSVL
jgi:hypothetical protein